MDFKRVLADIKCFLLDMDGTLYIGDEPIGNMSETLGFLREKGKQLVYLTNNSSKNTKEYEKKLTKLGFLGQGDYIYSSAIAAVEFLNKNRKGARVYLVATEQQRKFFQESGIVLDDENPEIAVLTFDTELTYGKLRKLTCFLADGVEFIATHPDKTCPAEKCFMPDLGSFLNVIYEVTKRNPDIIIGKPYKYMGEGIEEKYGFNKCEIMMVGDRLHTDIKFGVDCGFHTLLVMSGETDEKILAESSIKPEFILNDFNDVKNYF